MRKVILYSAVSLDGYIAKEDGSIDWLFDIPGMDSTDHGYVDFYSTVDIVIMGNTTFK